MNPKALNYGVDGPVFVLNTFLIGCLFLIGGVALFVWFVHSLVNEVLFAAAIAAGALCLWIAATVLWGSLVGKIQLRAKVIDSFLWRGDERVLGVGCGHGLLLIEAAKRLGKNGAAYGVDIWKQIDQAGNSPQATMKNARIEGVADRLKLTTGDARMLPFADESFDVIGSSWVLHNILRRRERERALAESIRVLKPGGRIIVIDVWLGYQYAKYLRDNGLRAVTVSRPYFLFFAPTFIVRGRKPDI